MAKIAAFVIPGYEAPADYANSRGLAMPAQIAANGGTAAVIESYWYQTTNTATSFNTSPGNGQVANADIQSVAAAAVTAGLEVYLKPQIVATVGGQNDLLPGGTIINDAIISSLPNGAGSSTGTNLYSPTGGFTSAINTAGPAGGNSRIVSWHSSAIPGSLNTAYGTVAAVNSTCTYVDANNLTLSAAGTGTPPVVLLVNEAGLATWFGNYQTLLEALLALCSFQLLEIDTEHTYLQTVAGSYYRALITTIQGLYPSLTITLAQQIASFDLIDVNFWDALKYIGLDWYRPIGSSAGGDSLATVEGNWTAFNGQTYLASLAAMSAAWGGKQIMFTEIGYPSVAGCGFSPGTVPGSGATPYNADQTVCVQAFFNQVWNQPWFAGFAWWLWAYPDPTVSEGHTYSPYVDQNSAFKPAGHLMGTYLGGSSWQHRAFTSGSTRYRLNPS